MCNPIQSAAPRRQYALLLYYITDRKQFAGTPAQKERKLIAKIRECALAGVNFIQLREKDLSVRELEQLAAAAMAAIPASSATRLLINSRIDVALACGAHGAHLPGQSLSASEARSIFVRGGNARPIIGVSAHCANEVALAQAHGADFVVFGPVFAKNGLTNPAGLVELAAAAERSSMPVLALGGVTLQNAEQCLKAGAAGIAAIRMFQDNDVDSTVKALRRIRVTGTPAG
jgi:thiamine-phosphate pyrophosphorylase